MAGGWGCPPTHPPPPPPNAAHRQAVGGAGCRSALGCIQGVHSSLDPPMPCAARRGLSLTDQQRRTGRARAANLLWPTQRVTCASEPTHAACTLFYKGSDPPLTHHCAGQAGRGQLCGAGQGKHRCQRAVGAAPCLRGLHLDQRPAAGGAAAIAPQPCRAIDAAPQRQPQPSPSPGRWAPVATAP